MQKVWIVFREDEGLEILGVFEDHVEATGYSQELAASRYPDERIYTGGFPVPFRVTDHLPPQ